MNYNRVVRPVGFEAICKNSGPVSWRLQGNL